MKTIINFIKKYKAEILIFLTAIISICTSFATLNVKYAAVTSVIIAIVSVLVEVLKNGINETAIVLLAKAIEMIINICKKEDIVSVSLNKSNGTIKEMSLDDIKKELKNALK